MPFWQSRPAEKQKKMGVGELSFPYTENPDVDFQTFAVLGIWSVSSSKRNWRLQRCDPAEVLDFAASWVTLLSGPRLGLTGPAETTP